MEFRESFVWKLILTFCFKKKKEEKTSQMKYCPNLYFKLNKLVPGFGSRSKIFNARSIYALHVNVIRLNNKNVQINKFELLKLKRCYYISKIALRLILIY